MHRFDLEDGPSGTCCIVVRAADGTVVLQSTALPTTEHATLALQTLRAALGRDWCYRVVQRRRGGPSFAIRIAQPTAECVSREYTSCDAMERDITLLKSAAFSRPAQIERIGLDRPSNALKSQSMLVNAPL